MKKRLEVVVRQVAASHFMVTDRGRLRPSKEKGLHALNQVVLAATALTAVFDWYTFSSQQILAILVLVAALDQVAKTLRRSREEKVK